MYNLSIETNVQYDTEGRQHKVLVSLSFNYYRSIIFIRNLIRLLYKQACILFCKRYLQSIDNIFFLYYAREL